MRSFTKFFLAALVGLAGYSHAAILFEDGFEGGTLNPAWTISETNQGKVSIRNDFEPASGTGHLVFEDSVADGIYSVAEATLKLDLTNKKNVVLTFKAKSLGNEPHYGSSFGYVGSTGGDFDGISVSFDQGGSWQVMEYFGGLDEEWGSYSYDLSLFNYFGSEYGDDVWIRFSAYDNAPAPIDGIAIDEVKIAADDERRVILEMPVSLAEGQAGKTGYVVLSSPSAEPLTLTFQQTPAGQLNLPESLVIPAGETMVSFPVSAVDDSLVNLERGIVVRPVIAGDIHTPVLAEVRIKDNDATPVVSLTLPETVKEGFYSPSNAKISLAAPIAADVEFTLTDSPDAQISFNTNVTIVAGTTETVFSIYSSNDSDLDGDIPVTVTASHPSFSPATGTVVALDDEIPVLSLEMAAELGEGTETMATVRVTGMQPEGIVVNLSAYSSTEVVVPSWVSIPAGGNSATFVVRVKDDTIRNLDRVIEIRASASGTSSVSRPLTIRDDESAPVFTIILPERLVEGDVESVGKISMNVAADVPVSFRLTAAPEGEIYIPYSLTIPAGGTIAEFTVRALDDQRIDGDIPVKVTANFSLSKTIEASTVAVDNENRSIRVDLPYGVNEDEEANGVVRISGTLETSLVVTLSSSLPGTLALPERIVIPAGYTSVSFPMSAVDNDLRDGTREVEITAAAGKFTSATATQKVMDNDPAGYEFNTLSDLVPVGTAFSVQVLAKDADGNQMIGNRGRVNLSVVLPDESSMPLSPGHFSFSGSSYWNGDVILPPVTGSGLRLRVTDASGLTADSTPFEAMRSVKMAAGDLVWDGVRSRFYASIRSAATEGPNRVVAIDPETLQIVAEISVGHDPGQLELTGGGEFLYVVLNGNGTIAKIDPGTMTVISTFSIGVNPSNNAVLGASDICAVAGEPNLLIVSQYWNELLYSYPFYSYYTRKSFFGVAVYDGGVARPDKVAASALSNSIEPSADPTRFFGFNSQTTEYGLRSLKLTASGITLASGPINSMGYSTQLDIRSAGNLVFSTSGTVVDGLSLQKTGTLPAAGFMRPDLASGRVFVLGNGAISSYDPYSLAKVHSATLPWFDASRSGSLIRWGQSSLAYRSGDSIVLIESPELVPVGPPTDLEVSIQATPDPAFAGQSITYTVTAENVGENSSKGGSLNISLSSAPSIPTATSTIGTPAINGSSISLPVGELAAGARVVLTIVTQPSSSSQPWCKASVSSLTIDENPSNNLASKFVPTAIPPGRDVITQLGLNVNNLVNDAARDRLWVTTVRSTTELPPEPTLFAIDPRTGACSQGVFINGTPATNSIALSGNGRFLYVGLSNVPEVCRFDLSQSPPVMLRIPLEKTAQGTANYAADIEVLDGDGTSFVMVGATDKAASVYDGTVMRGVRTGSLQVSRIERGSTPGTFVGQYYDYTNYNRTLTVSWTGITVTKSSSLVNGGYDFRSSGKFFVTNVGEIWDSATLAPKVQLGEIGAPCLDSSNSRAFMVGSSSLTACDMMNGMIIGRIGVFRNLGNYPPVCVRWGDDGLAFTGGDGRLSVLRWSLAVPLDLDANRDGIGDGWALNHFDQIALDPSGDPDGDGMTNSLEYLFATHPAKASLSPLKLMAAPNASANSFKIRFPRRKGFDRTKYLYQRSEDLTNWTNFSGTEAVISTATVDGVAVETVEATIPSASQKSGFVRMRWAP